LKQKNRADSLARGGDGVAARIEPGGYLQLDKNIPLPLSQEAFTLAVRVCDPTRTWMHPILGS
jgi:hypothetical protein